MKKTKLIVFASLIAFAACKETGKPKAETAAAPVAETPKAVPATLTEAETKAGVKLLFNGTTTEGWHVYLKDSTSHWSISEGVLSTKGGHNDLVSDAEYENFELMFDWKVGTAGNSGVFYGVGDEPSKYTATYFTGIEYQIIDEKGWKDKLEEAQKPGAVYDIYAPKIAASKGANEWNTGKIVVNKSKVQHYINEQLVADYVFNSPDYTARVKKSKFKEWALAKKTNLKGHIALQDHGQEVAFRNVKIKTL